MRCFVAIPLCILRRSCAPCLPRCMPLCAGSPQMYGHCWLQTVRLCSHGQSHGSQLAFRLYFIFNLENWTLNTGRDTSALCWQNDIGTCMLAGTDMYMHEGFFWKCCHCCESEREDGLLTCSLACHLKMFLSMQGVFQAAQAGARNLSEDFFS